MKHIIISLYLLTYIFIFQSCNEVDTVVFNLEQDIPNSSFQEETTYYNEQIILNAIVAKNEIYALNSSSFSNFTADSERDISSPVHGFNLSFFKKNCISKNYLALTSSANADQYIQFNSTNEDLFFYETILLNINQIGGIPTDSTLDYSHYNTTSFDNTAINQFDKAILPVIKKADAATIVFILFDLRELIGSTNPFNTNFPYNPLLNLPQEQYTEIVFPLETTTEINRIEAFRENFYVSTATNTYLIRPNGSYQFLMEGSADDFFEFDGKIYADFGHRIAFTSDDGETWEELNDVTLFNGPREFQDLYGHLIFFHEDDLYRVDPSDFSYSVLKNDGLKGSKITALLPFYQRMYVATLSGLFYKPIELLEP